MNFNVLEKFSKNTQIRNFLKIRPVGVELFHGDRGLMDGQTDRETDRDMTKLTVAFRNCVDAPKTGKQSSRNTFSTGVWLLRRANFSLRFMWLSIGISIPSRFVPNCYEVFLFINVLYLWDKELCEKQHMNYSQFSSRCWLIIVVVYADATPLIYVLSLNIEFCWKEVDYRMSISIYLVI